MIMIITRLLITYSIMYCGLNDDRNKIYKYARENIWLLMGFSKCNFVRRYLGRLCIHRPTYPICNGSFAPFNRNTNNSISPKQFKYKQSNNVVNAEAILWRLFFFVLRIFVKTSFNSDHPKTDNIHHVVITRYKNRNTRGVYWRNNFLLAPSNA